MKLQANKINTLAGHKDCIYTLESGLENQYFFSSGGDGLVAVWNLENPEIGKLVAQVPQSVYALKLIKERSQLLVGQNTEGLHLIHLEQTKELRSLKTTHTSIFDIQVIENVIFVAYADGSIQQIDINKWSIQHAVKPTDKSARSIALHPSGEFLATGFSDNYIRVFDIKTLQIIHSFEAHQNSVFTLAYSPDGTKLISGGRDAHLKVWDTETNYQNMHNIPAHLFAINHLVFNPKGNLLASCSMDKSIKIWDAQTFKLLKVIDKARYAGHGTSINKLLWTSYQNMLISGSDDRMLAVWDIQDTI
ncbi:MAG: WD40 repeat domain-containing protein [Raineya sp.]|jgi:WD40 repeat protein|nr:WD40 repeat domain-containing protein [Raineya sp.]